MRKLIVLLASVALVLGFALSASATSTWNFYGSARMSTFWNAEDEALGDDDELAWVLQGNSRIGANVSNEVVSGQFEYGTGINLRVLTGSWNFGPGVLTVGHGYTPIDTFPSNQVAEIDAGLVGWGAFYSGRNGMLQVAFGGAKIALVDPSGSTDLLTTTGETDNQLPRIEASYEFKGDSFTIKGVGGYQTYKVNNVTVATDPIGDYDVDAWMLGLYGRVAFGPVTVKGTAFYGQNVQEMGILSDVADAAVVNGTTLEDTNTFGATGVVVFKATDMLTFEAGIGYLSADNDTYAEKDDAISYYVQCVISPAPGVYIIPEVSVFDHGDSSTGADEGTETSVGAKWQINF